MFSEIEQETFWHFRVFDLIDRHWGYAYLKSDAERDRNLALAVATARASDRAVAVSPALADELGSLVGTDVEVLANAIDLDRVAGALGWNGRANQGRNGRRAVYVGGWNDRVDFDLFERLTQSLPEWDFLVIGGEARIERSNVEFLGNLDYDSAIRAIASCSVGLLPFKDTEYTRSSSFLKIFDYLAAGVTVLATDLPSVRAIAEEFPAHVLVRPGVVWAETLRGNSWVFPSELPLEALPSTSDRVRLLVEPLDASLGSRLGSEGRS